MNRPSSRAGSTRIVHQLLSCTFTLLVASALGRSTSASAQALPLPDPRFSGHVGRTYKDSDPAAYPQPVRAPANAPNIVLIMLDDVGFGAFSVFGGAVLSPNLEALAAQGLRFNRFHTAGICSPTRAALLTGRNPHRAGFGLVGELATGYDGYVGYLPRSTATVAEVLRQNGYATAMFGKNHNTPNWEGGPAGPFNHWPTGFGFDYFYGFNGWGTSNWQPVLFENTRPVVTEHAKDYHLNADLVDHAIRWAQSVKSANPAQPYFLYLATGATHSPHHAPAGWIARFHGKFDAGWDAYREATFARQKALGVVPKDAALTPRPALIPAWNSLSTDRRAAAARQMEVYAGYGAYTDDEVGRLLKAVRSMPDADNTLIVYIVGDNGASAEGGVQGSLNEIAPANGLEGKLQFTPQVLAELGGPRWDNNYPMGWAWAMDTPFQYYKQVVSHLGAIRNPLVVSWPARIRDKGASRSQFLDVTDIAPTLLAAAGVAAPKVVNGIEQKSLDGVNALPVLLDAQAKELRATQYFEVFSNRGIYDHGWFASALINADASNPNRAQLDPDKVTWELYDLDQDFSQAHDLAAKQPAKLRQLQDLWWAEAARNDVLPLDWRAGERIFGAKRPNPAEGRSSFTYYSGMMVLPGAISPRIFNRSWSATVEGTFGPGDAGMLITEGGLTGGWALYLHGGQVVFEYNCGLVARYRVAATVPLGTRRLEAQFAYDGRDGKPAGAGGTLTLLADGRALATGRIEQTLTTMFSVTDGLDVGLDLGSPVSDAYEPPFRYTGQLDSVTIDLK